MPPLPTVLDWHLMEFNQLPSRTLHPSRCTAFARPAVLEAMAAAPGLALGWHRHWSQEILRAIGLQDRPVTDAARPELALALLSPDRLEQCAQRLGVVLCGPRLRRAVGGDEVRALVAGLGTNLLGFACRMAPALHGGIAESVDWTVAQTLLAVDALGRGTMLAALRGAGPEVVLRAELKLPDLPARDTALASAEALSLGLSVLKQIEPTCHS